jgi:phosphate transport system substrate-binding protein
VSAHTRVLERQPGAMTKRLTIILAAVTAALVAVAAATAKSNDTSITGAGSTFVSPLVSVWTPAIGHAFGYNLQYSAVGSGAGITAVTSKQVDFGASDAPLTPDQATACGDCVQIPWALSATAIAYNVPGSPAHLNLDGKTLAKIFLGQITNWNDGAIKTLNKGANLPDLKITPVFRSDSSGTTYNFTDYLSAVSPDFRSKVGNSTSVQFPAGQGARGSAGVAGLVSRTDGAIGYVDVAFAVKNHIKFAAVRNNAGKFLFPSLRRIEAAAAAFTKVPGNNEMHIVNPPKSAALAYPISTYTYIIVHKSTPHGAELRKMIFWALTQGQQGKFTAPLLFAPLSTVKPVLVSAEKTLKQIHT